MTDWGPGGVLIGIVMERVGKKWVVDYGDAGDAELTAGQVRRGLVAMDE